MEEPYKYPPFFLLFQCLNLKFSVLRIWFKRIMRTLLWLNSKMQYTCLKDEMNIITLQISIQINGFFQVVDQACQKVQHHQDWNLLQIQSSRYFEQLVISNRDSFPKQLRRSVCRCQVQPHILIRNPRIFFVGDQLEFANQDLEYYYNIFFITQRT